MADEIVLNFHDSLLRKSDIKLLDEGQWLNDKIIGFMFEYFEYILFNKLKNVLFIDPDVAQYVKLCKGAELAIFIEPLNLHSKTTIFIPVNSNANAETVGGTHWSLLVYDAHQKKFQHFDSFASSNNAHAVRMSKAIEPFLKAKQNIYFVEEKCPQQKNTEQLCKRLQHEGLSQKDLDSEVNAESVKIKRTKIKKIIQDLRETHPS